MQCKTLTVNMTSLRHFHRHTALDKRYGAAFVSVLYSLLLAAALVFSGNPNSMRTTAGGELTKSKLTLRRRLSLLRLTVSIPVMLRLVSMQASCGSQDGWIDHRCLQ